MAARTISQPSNGSALDSSVVRNQLQLIENEVASASSIDPGHLHTPAGVSATGTPSATTYWRGDNTWATISGSGTVTNIATGAGLTGGPITTTGTIALDSKLSPLDTLGTAGQSIRVNAGVTALEYYTPLSGGNVVGPASSTDNAIVRFDTTTGQLIQNSSAILGDNGSIILTSTASTAFVVGPAGTTSPTLTVDSSIASAVTGLSIQGLATGTNGGVILQTTSPTASEEIGLASKGSGAVRIRIGSTDKQVMGTGNTTYTSIAHNFVESVSNSASTVRFSVLNATDTALTASTEAPNVYFALNNTTRTHATGSYATQRDFRITGSSHIMAAGGGTITDASAFSVDPPVSNNLTVFTNVHAIYVPTSSVITGTGTATNSYGLTVNALSGASTNYAAQFLGGQTVFGGNLIPSANDGAAFGTGTLSFSDLFLASGGVINFNNSNYTITHSAGLLTTNGNLSLTTSGVLTTGTIELGAASDTTISRSSAGVIAVESVVIPSISSTNTLTNKRITRRSATTNAPGATPTTNSDNVDLQIFTGLATAITSMTTNLSGTPIRGDFLEFNFTDDGTARGITWGASFVASTTALPSTTVISTLLAVLFEWNGSAWRCVGVA